jgi:hypothetical protein
VLVLEEGIALASVGMVPALAVTLGLVLSQAPDLLALLDKPLASRLLALLLGGVEGGPVGDLAERLVLVPVSLLRFCQVTVRTLDRHGTYPILWKRR